MNSLEKFAVYRKSIKFLAIAYSVVECIPRGHATLCDQLKRSSLSICLNIAEASGKVTVNEKRQHFTIARASALESLAAVDVCRVIKIIDEGSFLAAKPLLEEIIAMLSILCRGKRSVNAEAQVQAHAQVKVQGKG